MRTTIIIFIFSTAAACLGAPDYLPEKPGPHFHTVPQSLSIRFRTAEAAERARLNILPLPDGKTWAVTCRWDDNTTSHGLSMRDTMNGRGIKGTYYFNGPHKRAFGWNMEEVPAMLEGGHSIGGHGWQHGYAGVFSGHGMFAELMKPRLYWESVLDKPVCSHAFAYGNFASRIDDYYVKAREVGETLFRSGFIQVGLDRFGGIVDAKTPLCNNIKPGDGRADPEKQRAYIAKTLADPEIQAAQPCLSFGIHAWTYAGKFDRADASFALLAGRPDYWYCNQGEYGAYRLQYQHTTIETAVKDRIMQVTLQRTSPLVVMHDVPLTIEINGIGNNDIEAIDAGTARVDRSGSRFNLGYPDAVFAPVNIGWIANEDNRRAPEARDSDPDFDQLRGILTKDGALFKIVIRNTGAPLEDVHCTWRMPLAYRDGYLAEPLDRIGKDFTHTREWLPDTEEHAIRFGRGFYVAQLDFRRGGVPGRLYLTCRAPDQMHDPSYPALGFSRLGPVPDADYSPDLLAAIVRGEKDHVQLSDGTTLPFIPLSAKKDEKAEPWMYDMDDFHPEMIFLSGIPYVHQKKEFAGTYIYRSTVKADAETPVQVEILPRSKILQTAVLNGTTIFADGKAQPAILNAGDNDLVLAAKTDLGKGQAENAAFVFRLGKPQAGIKYTSSE